MKRRYKKHFHWLRYRLQRHQDGVKTACYGSQVYRVYCKFGGIKQVKEALALVNIHPHKRTFYRWLEINNGVFYQHILEQIIYVARFVGVLLTEQDLDPRVQISDEEAEAYHETMGVYKSVHVPHDLKEARKAALIKELYEKERDGKIKSEEEALKERKEYIVKYRKMHEAARKHFKDKRGNETNE